MSTITAQNFKDLTTAKAIDAAYITDGAPKMSGVSDAAAGAPTGDASLNVGSRTDGGTGLMYFAQTAPMASAFGGANVACNSEVNGSAIATVNSSNITASYILAVSVYWAGGGYSVVEPVYFNALRFGDLA